ncbi:hypothetical protein Rhopal_001966-T1 [Rhodotorula paludigena]|uniref:Oxidation resistance protein 1 n=1 Tax=Rhodotorula paludigena TaxID=86838 RepID=A0AAV5GHL1_9BASI|nr:hypothetical protein Rhopal_001966-T1 [Rhodotorula paludigena]
MGPSQLPVDLSDLDPFSPTASRRPSPHPQGPLFAHPSAASSSSSSIAPPPVPSAQQPVHTSEVRPGHDPLGGLLGTLSLGGSTSASSSASASSSSRRGPPALPGPDARAVRAQEERSSRILHDLSRGPFASPSPPPVSAAPPGAFSDEPASLPSPASSVPIPRSLQRKPSRGGSHTSFSPPRRLSTLMDLGTSSSVHSPSSPPAESSIFSNPFHPSLVRSGESQRRMRQASGSAAAGAGSGAERIEQALEGDLSGDWGDFQAASPLRANDAPLPAPAPAPAPAALPPKPPSTTRSSTFPTSTSTPSLSASVAGGLSSIFSHPPSAYDRRKPSPTASPTRAATGPSAFDPTAQPIKLLGVRPGVSRVLEEDVAEGIRPSLPPRLRLSHRWQLLYSLDQHGISLTTLFSALERGLRERDGGFVLVVKSERGEVFGAYASEAMRDAARDARGATRWGGDGSCFLWKSVPFAPTDFRIGSSVRIFKPTFRNTYFLYSTSSSSSSALSFPTNGSTTVAGDSFLAFGGGEDGVFGLYIDGLFERGWTGRCETFGNEPLVDVKKRGGGEADETGKFEVVGLECWAVGS